MRALILAMAVLGVLANADAAKAGMSTTPREALASVDTAPPTETNHPDRHRTEGRANHHHHPRGIGGPIGAIGGLFRR